MAETPVRYAKLANRLTTQDAAFLYGESEAAPMHIGALATFDGPLDLAQARSHVEQRLHLIPRYRQRLAFVPFNLAHPTWEDDPDFRLNRHIMEHRLPEGCSESDLLKAAMKIYEPPLARKRPVWEMHLFSGLEGGRSAVLWKTHHCLVDGVSGMELLNAILDLRPDAPPPEPPEEPWNPSPLPRPARTLVRAMFDLAEMGLDAAREASEIIPRPGGIAKRGKAVAGAVGGLVRMAAQPVVTAPWNAGLVTQARSLAWQRCSFTEMRAIRNAIRGTVNDVVLAILFEAAARYLRHHHCPVEDKVLRIGCPVNVRRRNESGGLGNRVSMMFPELPAGPMDAADRLEAVAEETDRRKTSGEPRMLDVLMSASDFVPPAMMGLASAIGNGAIEATAPLLAQLPDRMRREIAPRPAISFVATNVPGAQVPMFLVGRRMIDYVGLVPLVGNLGFAVAILSYNQNLYFGLIADPWLMPDVETMKYYVNQVFDELKVAAGERGAFDQTLDRQATVAVAGAIRAAQPDGNTNKLSAIPATPRGTRRQMREER